MVWYPNSPGNRFVKNAKARFSGFIKGLSGFKPTTSSSGCRAGRHGAPDLAPADWRAAMQGAGRSRAASDLHRLPVARWIAFDAGPPGEHDSQHPSPASLPAPARRVWWLCISLN